MTAVRRVVRAGRAAGRRAKRHVEGLAPIRRTALFIPPEQRPLPPSAFAGFGDNAWIVPPTRVVDPGRIAIGDGTWIMEHATLAVLGDAEGPVIRIGNNARIARFCSIIAEVGVTIGDSVATSDQVCIIDTWRSPFGGQLPPSAPPPAPVRIGDGAYLGMSSTILPGVTVGEGAYVAEYAVVVADVPAYTVARGNPARIIRTYDPSSDTWEGRPWP